VLLFVLKHSLIQSRTFSCKVGKQLDEKRGEEEKKGPMMTVRVLLWNE